MKLESKPNESEAEFHVRVQDHLDKVREEAIEKLQGRYQVKEKRLLDRLSTAKARVEKEASDRTGSLIETGIAVLGALLGKPTPTRIGTAVRKGSRVLKERGDMSRAQERVAMIEEDIEALGYELEEKIDQLDEKYALENYEIETFGIKPRKGDIDITLCALVWRVA